MLISRSAHCKSHFENNFIFLKKIKPKEKYLRKCKNKVKQTTTIMIKKTIVLLLGNYTRMCNHCIFTAQLAAFYAKGNVCTFL
jgi:hypothetical protein